jgi:hypothetical protein
MKIYFSKRLFLILAISIIGVLNAKVKLPALVSD